MESDILFPVRNNFYLGAYQAAIAEAADLDTLSESQKSERDVFVYRSYIELGSYELVINEISESSSQALQAIRLLAQYAGNKDEKVKILATVKDWLDDPSTKGNAVVLLVAGIILSNEGNFEEALKACHTGLSLDMREETALHVAADRIALSVQVLLKINRVDQAEKQLKAMVSIDEDATITQLATALVNVELGGAKIQEAFFIYQELGERYNWTARLHNSAAVCSMKMGNWQDAEKRLNTAFERDAKNPETIANLICTGLHLGKPAARHASLLRSTAPQHLALQRMAAAEENFGRAANGLVAT